MKKQNQIYTTLAATLLLLLFAGQASAQQLPPMRDNLTIFMPADDPYCGSGRRASPTAPGELVYANLQNPCESITLTTVGKNAAGEGPDFPAGVVDWVLVEVRDATNPDGANVSTTVARKPALLLQNGRVVDAEAFVALGESERDACLATTAVDAAGCPQVSFGSAAFGGDTPTVANSAFLVVRHRNHLDIQSAGAVTGMIDFSDTDNIRGGAAALTLPSGTARVHAMFLGDVTNDGNVNSGDATYIDGDLSRADRENDGYHIQDANMNRTANSGDATRIDGNLSRRNRENASFVCAATC